MKKYTEKQLKKIVKGKIYKFIGYGFIGFAILNLFLNFLDLAFIFGIVGVCFVAQGHDNIRSGEEGA